MSALPPGAAIGILGGGQLGRMLGIAAAEMGYRVVVLSPEDDSPAAQVANESIVAAYEDEKALNRFAAAVDAVTIEFENIPTATLEFLARSVPVRPGAGVLRITQDRLLEKRRAREVGLRTPEFETVDDLAGLRLAIETLGTPCLLKTRRFGYDGKGQAMISAPSDAEAAWEAIGRAPAILESLVDFQMEISVIVARGVDGTAQAFDPVENRHRNGILDLTLAPAGIPDDIARQARDIGVSVAEALDVVGMVTVELFLDRENRLLINEFAPRVHNSGHWTREACTTSQFRQQIRTVAGLPPASATRHANAVMRNLIGDDALNWADWQGDPDAALHLYGKRQIRPGRKMGHVTRLLPLDTPPDASRLPARPWRDTTKT